MKRDMFRKLMAASLATVMTVGLVGCGSDAQVSTESSTASSSAASSQASVEPDEPVEPYPVLTDANGNVYDLGGMEVIIRNWWSSGERGEAKNAYDEAKYDYLDWAMEKYNFTIKELAISDWGSAPADFVDYVTTGGDENNYVFVLRDDPAVVSAMANDLMYDLSTIDCLDFSQPQFQANKLHEQYSKNGKINCMYAGYSEPRTGVYYNRRLLQEAGIDPDAPLDMQAAGTWTWDAWTDMMATVQSTIGDKNGDGVMDIFGFDANYGVPVSASVYSNNGEYVGLENGAYTYKFEDANTVQALEWITDTFSKYVLQRPEGSEWDYYKQAFINGECAFMPDDAYCGGPNGFLMDMTDDISFVMFPKGPQADDYTNCWTNNPAAIPGCYDADRAEKVAFAYYVYTAEVPGYEGYLDLSQYADYKFDERSVNETCKMMTQKGMVTYHGLISGLDMGAPFLWKMGPSADITAILEEVRESYKSYIADANK